MEKRKLINLIILGLFLTTFFIGVVSAVDDPTTEAKGLFASLGDIQVGQQTRTGIAKVLLMALVAMIVYSISDFLPFVGENNSVKWGVSIVVAILAFLFVPMADIQGLLTTYEAMGIVLTSIVPLVILFVFSVQFETKMKNLHKVRGVALAKLLNAFLFVGFIIYLVGKTMGYAPGVRGGVLGWFYPASILGTLIWWLGLKDKVEEWLQGEEEAEKARTAGQTVGEAVKGAQALKATFKGLAGSKMTEAEKRWLMGMGRGD